MCHPGWHRHQSPKTRALWSFYPCGQLYHYDYPSVAFFRPYLEEQLTLLYQDYDAHISVEPSQHEIPYPYVIDGSELTLDRSMSAGLTRHFPTTELSQIGDETADGIFIRRNFSPLSHFDARRVDFRWRDYVITRERRLNIFNLLCCSPTTPATSMSLCVGVAARSSTRTAHISRFLVRAGSGSPPKPKRQKKPSPIRPEETPDARPAFNHG